MCFLFHKWGKWIDIEINTEFGTCSGQERRCLKCNKVEVRFNG